MRVLSSNPKVIAKVCFFFISFVCCNVSTYQMECKLIFSNIDELLAAHSNLLADLDRQMSSHTGRIISGCFVDAVR